MKEKRRLEEALAQNEAVRAYVEGVMAGKVHGERAVSKLHLPWRAFLTRWYLQIRLQQQSSLVIFRAFRWVGQGNMLDGS
jgi:hypothetical protein